jgi:fido (protein-threonine AMPylation protein)
MLWIDPIQDDKIGAMLREKYPSYIDIEIQDLFAWVGIEMTPKNVWIVKDISQYWLSESRFQALHASIFNWPAELAGVYRSIVMMAGEKHFIDFWEIQKEMTSLFDKKYESVWGILYWMIEVLGRIHPFIDMNRRTIFIAADAHLIYLWFSPIYWWKNRNIWEDAWRLSHGIDAKKRLHILMESILENQD